MSKRSVQILSVALLIVGAVWAPSSAKNATSNEARYQQWQRPIDTWVRLVSLERHLPSGFSKAFRLSALEQRCLDKAEKIEEALVTSGYLTNVPVAVPNASAFRTQIGNRLRKATETNHVKWGFFIRSNEVVVLTCRPQDVGLCVRAIESD